MSVVNLKILVCKLAAEELTHGHETRRKKPVRGFYTDPSPGFFDLKGKFKDAARTNPETKVAEALVTRDLLDYFGFHAVKRAAEDSEDPVKALVDVFNNYDFGFANNGKTQASERKEVEGVGLRGSEIQGTTNIGWDW